MSDFEKLINASDLIEWIIETDPDWCVGSVRSIIDHIDKMPSAQTETHEERTETHGVCLDAIDRQAVIDTVCKIILGFISDEDGVMNDTEKTLLSVNKAVCNGVRELPPAQPEMNLDEWCTDCKEYDHKRHCCPRWNRVIRQTLKDMKVEQPEPSMEECACCVLSKPQQMWIPCSERLPDELAEVNITWINTNPAPYYEFTKGKPNTGSAVYYKGRWYWYSAVCADYLAEYGFSPDDDMDDAIKVIAWMPLPEPYREEGD